MCDRQYTVAVLPGDGIGVEVTEAGVAVLKAAAARVDVTLNLEFMDAGAVLYERTGDPLPQSTLRAAEACDAILLGAMGLPGVRYPDGREIAPQLDLRTHFELFAGVRPIRSIPGLEGPLRHDKANRIDFVIVRESTEGLFAERDQGHIKDNTVARDSLVVSRAVSEKLFDFTFRLAMKREAMGKAGTVTIVDKANVLTTMAFFRRIFDETARRFPSASSNHLYVDAAALNLVRQPWIFDVLVTENMFGDILSDLAAGLVGGMGVAPSADIGAHMAVFQPSHGSAPDIAGTGRANPIAMILSVEMMCAWLGETFGDVRCTTAAEHIRSAVDQTFVKQGVRPAEWGGRSTTKDIAEAVINNLPALEDVLA